MKFLADDIYDVRALRKYILFLIVFAGLSYLSKGYFFVAVPIFVLGALTGGKSVDLLFWVMLLCFTGVANPYVFPRTMVTFAIARLSLFLVAALLALRVFGRRNATIVSPFVGIFLYIGWSAVISLQGFDPIVSYLKIILFIPIYIALYAIANEVTASTRVNARAVRSAILAIVCFIVFGSLVLLPFPGISQLQARQIEDVAKLVEMVAEGHSLFMGVTNHSQALGPMLGVLLTAVFADLLFSVRRWDPLYVGLLGMGVFLIVKSSSRTGMGTFIAGIAMTIWLFWQARVVGTIWKSKVTSWLFTAGIVGTMLILMVPSTRDRVFAFMLKVQRNDASVSASDVTFDNVTSTRQGLADVAMHNFRNKPFTGNGFQVSANMQHTKRNGLMDYMSAPIEKGFWPTAILEEGGVPGMMLFGGFLLVAISLLIKRHAYIGAATFWAFVVVNCGEFNFFSMSYTGGFEWALVFAAVILDGQRMKNVGLEVWTVPIDVVMDEVGMDEWMRRRA